MKRLSSQSKANLLSVGLDVGSTTVKAVALDDGGAVVFRAYRRHNARQSEQAAALIEEIARQFPETLLRIAVTGSGGAPLAEAIGAPFVQEVVANAEATQQRCPRARTAIELGGQDAKIVFFAPDERTGRLTVTDMRMNGSCAGGTGAFIDEIAALLNVAPEKFDELAAAGTTVHSISGRCGVFAKTDIQPLAAAGVPREDLALSTFHAIAKQTIGGLAQGHAIEAPVVFEGGPLQFNPTLVSVFAEKLALDPQDVIVPEHPETIVALGAAMLLGGPFGAKAHPIAADLAARALRAARDVAASMAAPLFASAEEKDDFVRRHGPDAPLAKPSSGTQRAFLGIDSGSTTTKIALLDENGALLDAAYASNNGDPLATASEQIAAIRDRWARAAGQLDIVAVGTTGYGEALFAEAYQADVAVVETAAHARAALAHTPDATFVLDIGGQDMKALWIADGVVTDIVVNEACSSGCGSFLEGFAASLGIERDDIAQASFSSASPADLGSRCTVFMTSSIITAQRAGCGPEDIMAGLARSVVENVFTKVIRTSNLNDLGRNVVVQGGTFANDAVLRAFESYLGRPVTRTPHPGLAGAMGAAIAAREHADAAGGTTSFQTSFIGLDAAAKLECHRESGVACPHCSNHCALTIVRFSTGGAFVTGNRCPRGAENARKEREVSRDIPNLFEERARLLFRDYPLEQIRPHIGTTIGLPRVLSMWDTAPFWSTLFRSLGFSVRFSHPSSRERYEKSLSSIPSDTACFPAKLAHSHIRDLADQGVDRIFMPVITAVEPESAAPHSESMCALVKGYPLVIRSSDNPEKSRSVPFDAPLFHWHSPSDRAKQLSRYLQDTFDITPQQARRAIAAGDAAQRAFKAALQARGEQVLEKVEAEDAFAVVLAGRPYHNDPLVLHDIPALFAAQNVTAIPVDALPGLNDIRLGVSRLDIVNNYHARMLAGALYAAGTDCLEYAQIVSFGCGHDAYLTDEIARLMRSTSAKSPLVLKVDESEARGPLSIRVRSFVETATLRRRRAAARGSHDTPSAPDDPYSVKFRDDDFDKRTVLVPNTSHAFARLMAAVFSRQGLQAIPLDAGGEEAIALGKKYTHNDICFPAQMVIGEALWALNSGRYDPDRTAVGMAKYVGDCRLTHYSALLCKALDDAGYPQVPIITNDMDDERNLHPGFKMSLASALNVAAGLPMIDALEELLRKMRPYELEPGSTQAAFEAALDCVIEGMRTKGARGARLGFKRAIDLMKSVRYDRSHPRPQVLIVGEYLLNFHPGANRNIEGYLEAHGMEVVEARMTDVIRKTYFYQLSQVREFDVDKPLSERMLLAAADAAFEAAHAVCDRIASAHPLYEPPCRLPELVKESDPIVHHTFDAGEGVLIPAEILHHYRRGMRAFVILQPFGCLPNHIVGRGIVKSLRERCPDAQILALDYDPDVSSANLENRLQMLVMEQRIRAGN